MPLVLGTLSMAAPPTTMTTPALCRPVPCQLAVGGDGGTANSCKALPTHRLRRKATSAGELCKDFLKNDFMHLTFYLRHWPLHSFSRTGSRSRALPRNDTQENTSRPSSTAAFSPSSVPLLPRSSTHCSSLLVFINRTITEISRNFLHIC